MTFLEMINRGYWAIDDDADNPTEITLTDMKALINDGLEALGAELNIIKSATLTFTSGVASLPSDFIAPEACYDDDELLDQIEDITLKVDATDTTSQFFIPNNTQLYIYGTTPTGTVTLWYKARPTALSADADTPTNLPKEFHRYIPEVYVKAIHALRNNKLNTYNGLMVLWDTVRGNVGLATKEDRNFAAGHIMKDVYDIELA